jgi:hypothetical protein
MTGKVKAVYFTHMEKLINKKQVFGVNLIWGTPEDPRGVYGYSYKSYDDARDKAADLFRSLPENEYLIIDDKEIRKE